VASPERTTRGAALDGLRGLAALAVFFLHVWIYRGPSKPARDGFWDSLLFEMRLGLVLFFVLSGYLLYRQFARAAIQRRELDVGRFAKRRAARILPAYYVAILGSLALLAVAGGMPGLRSPDSSELPLFAVFGQNYSEGTILRLNPVTWTLCLEVAFYALLPALGWAAYRLLRGRVRGQAWMLAGIVVLGLAWNAVAFALGWGQLALKALPAYLPYFACGMLLALLVEARAAERLSFGPRATAGLVCAGLGLVVLDGWWHATAVDPGSDVFIQVLSDLPAAAGFALLVAAAASGGGRAIAWLRARPVAALGTISYGFYLWQIPVILLARRLGVLPDGFLPAFAVALVPALAIATASWVFVERPVLGWVGRRTRGTGLEARAAP
jgi:peptidoglycan/LPS O-acetylase OafA/YrhL